MAGRRSESVILPTLDGGTLSVYSSYLNQDSDFAVLYVHGFGSTRSGQKAEAVESACAGRGWTFAAFDFRGHGVSSGTLLELRGSRLLEDLELVRDYLVGRGIPKMCPVGSSMGGWAASWFALRHPQSVPACALIAPALDFLHSRWALLTEAERERWRQTGKLKISNQWIDVELGYGLAEEREDYPPERIAAELSRPILIFHGLKDEVVSVDRTLRFARNVVYPDVELRLFAHGDHRLLSFAGEMAEESCRFFARYLENEL